VCEVDPLTIREGVLVRDHGAEGPAWVSFLWRNIHSHPRG
jgi:hypothetical protein